VTVFKEDITKGVANRFNSTGVRLAQASPHTPFLALISQRSKLQIVNLETAVLYSQLDSVHRGEVHFLEWNGNGTWLFVASKSEPNIECFHMSPQTPGTK
jgi:hypothetical protein